MGIFDTLLLALFLGSFVASCACLGATPKRDAKDDAEAA